MLKTQICVTRPQCVKKLPWYSIEVTERNHDCSLKRAGFETGNLTVGRPEIETRTPTESSGVWLNGEG